SDQREHRAVISAIVAIADSLGIIPIAQNISTAEHLAWVTELRCPAGQGPLFVQPKNASMAIHWLSRWQERHHHDRNLDLLRHG
ncbi:MAG: EAL domain-containing protein, partial [Geminicoccaceae bacterium]